MIIYLIRNKINGMCYVGQTTRDLQKRINEHRSGSASSKNTYIGRAIKKYGKDNFDFSLIDKCGALDELNKLEVFYISLFNTLKPSGYNIALGGDNNLLSEAAKQQRKTRRHTEESKRKMSQKAKGIKKSEKHKKKISDTLRGRAPSTTTIEKIRRAALLRNGHTEKETEQKLLAPSKKALRRSKDYVSPYLSTEVVIEIKKLLDKGVKGSVIWKKFDISKSVVSKIKTGTTHRHIMLEKE